MVREVSMSVIQTMKPFKRSSNGEFAANGKE